MWLSRTLENYQLDRDAHGLAADCGLASSARVRRYSEKGMLGIAQSATATLCSTQRSDSKRICLFVDSLKYSSFHSMLYLRGF